MAMGNSRIITPICSDPSLLLVSLLSQGHLKIVMCMIYIDNLLHLESWNLISWWRSVSISDFYSFNRSIMISSNFFSCSCFGLRFYLTISGTFFDSISSSSFWRYSSKISVFSEFDNQISILLILVYNKSLSFDEIYNSVNSFAVHIIASINQFSWIKLSIFFHWSSIIRKISILESFKTQSSKPLKFEIQ